MCPCCIGFARQRHGNLITCCHAEHFTAIHTWTCMLHMTVHSLPIAPHADIQLLHMHTAIAGSVKAKQASSLALHCLEWASQQQHTMRAAARYAGISGSWTIGASAYAPLQLSGLPCLSPLRYAPLLPFRFCLSAFAFLLLPFCFCLSAFC